MEVRCAEAGHVRGDGRRCSQPLRRAFDNFRAAGRFESLMAAGAMLHSHLRGSQAGKSLKLVLELWLVVHT